MISRDDIFVLSVCSKRRSEIKSILYPDTGTYRYSDDEESTVYPEVAFLRLASKVFQSTDLDDSENELQVNELSWIVNTVLDIFHSSGFYFGLDYTEFNYFWEIIKRYSSSILSTYEQNESLLSNKSFTEMLIKYDFEVSQISTKDLGEYLHEKWP